MATTRPAYVFTSCFCLVQSLLFMLFLIWNVSTSPTIPSSSSPSLSSSSSPLSSAASPPSPSAAAGAAVVTTVPSTSFNLPASSPYQHFQLPAFPPSSTSPPLSSSSFSSSPSLLSASPSSRSLSSRVLSHTPPALATMQLLLSGKQPSLVPGFNNNSAVSASIRSDKFSVASENGSITATANNTNANTTNNNTTASNNNNNNNGINNNETNRIITDNGSQRNYYHQNEQRQTQQQQQQQQQNQQGHKKSENQQRWRHRQQEREHKKEQKRKPQTQQQQQQQHQQQQQQQPQLLILLQKEERRTLRRLQKQQQQQQQQQQQHQKQQHYHQHQKQQQLRHQQQQQHRQQNLLQLHGLNSTQQTQPKYGNLYKQQQRGRNSSLAYLNQFYRWSQGIPTKQRDQQTHNGYSDYNGLTNSSSLSNLTSSEHVRAVNNTRTLLSSLYTNIVGNITHTNKTDVTMHALTNASSPSPSPSPSLTPTPTPPPLSLSSSSSSPSSSSSSSSSLSSPSHPSLAFDPLSTSPLTSTAQSTKTLITSSHPSLISSTSTSSSSSSLPSSSSSLSSSTPPPSLTSRTKNYLSTLLLSSSTLSSVFSSLNVKANPLKELFRVEKSEKHAKNNWDFEDKRGNVGGNETDISLKDKTETETQQPRGAVFTGHNRDTVKLNKTLKPHNHTHRRLYDSNNNKNNTFNKNNKSLPEMDTYTNTRPAISKETFVSGHLLSVLTSKADHVAGKDRPLRIITGITNRDLSVTGTPETHTPLKKSDMQMTQNSTKGRDTNVLQVKLHSSKNISKNFSADTDTVNRDKESNRKAISDRGDYDIHEKLSNATVEKNISSPMDLVRIKQSGRACV
ncbi:putative uncharacterized protein DDB_G0277255 isoform X4 [Octopus sinensis]|uniref:Uncharacterized protein n=1 Tax=Octopus sinensis TaxID=2607531 RepID=A0A7E6ET15_9MOLL|nr:putative uncharacterized protein DDB_G0277255 isoform X4 [Octopus sinensis]